MDYPDTGTSPRPGLRPRAAEGVTALYAEHAVGLIRLGFIMLGDRGAAEDAVQDAFLGLYRSRWTIPLTAAAAVVVLAIALVLVSIPIAW